MRILVTGGAGFIGAHLSNFLQSRNHEVLSLDNLSDYYSIELKNARVLNLLDPYDLPLAILDIWDFESVSNIVSKFKPKAIIHLAAQAGVRISLESSQKYIDANITGFFNISRAAMEHKVEIVMYASSSSVYGDSSSLPFSENSLALSPRSIYGVTKLANEKLAEVLSQSSDLIFRGIRFFTVYGEWGRPDMAYFQIAASAINGKAFNLYGDGSVSRDFTYISDAVEKSALLLEQCTSKEKGTHDVVNIGGGNAHTINELIDLLSKNLGIHIVRNTHDSNKADSKTTVASKEYLERLIGNTNFVPLEKGLSKFATWIQKQEISSKLDTWI
jgi:UDP-glucuronate 4-epimerase